MYKHLLIKSRYIWHYQCVCVCMCVCVCVCVQHVKRVLPLLRQGDNDEPDRANEPLAVLDIEAEEPEP